MAGDQLRHVFTFQNSFPHELTLNAEVDLRKSCGCTTASLAHHRLESGQATTLAVEVDTRSKRGLIHEVVGVAWTDALGRRYEYGYAVRAMVNVAIVCHPPELTFSSSEVAEGTIKRVECSSDLAVDWENAKLLTSSPDLEIVHQLITKQNRLQVELRRRDAGTATYETAQVRINVPRKMCSAKRSESNDGRLGVEGQLLVFSRHQPTLAVRPRFPCFHVKGDSTTWSGRLIITGDAVAGGEQLDSIYSSEGTVDFRAEALGHGALQADVTLVPRKFGADLRTMTMPLVVRMVNGQEIRVVVQLSKTA